MPVTSEVERVDFIAVPTLDRERSAKFYGETLGLERNPNSSEQWMEFEIGNVTLALLPHEYTGRSEFTPSSGPIALRVSDVDEARRKLEEAGVEFPMETIDSGVCHIAPFFDPDGNSLMLHRRYAPYADGSTP
ncbi:MAG: VOC family protein [Actinobacteria bacterium]|nr:VOC family protein [Actinomycetota bacterium]